MLVLNAADSRPSRAGRYVQQPAGYRAFIPAPLPPDPPLAVDGEPQAVMSSQIEGTRSSLQDLLAAGANNLVARLVDAGVLREITGFARNRRFRFEPYLRLFEEPGE